MIRQHWSMSLTLAAAILAVAPFASAQDASKQEQPKLTPEQQAEMKAYQDAGTPGEPHKKLAAMAGSYSVKTKSWFEPGGKPIEESGTATRSVAIDGRVLVEQFQGTMMGSPLSMMTLRPIARLPGVAPARRSSKNTG